MTLQEFRDYIEETPHGTPHRFSISSPFSWRGSYNEVAFEILEGASTREDILCKIEEAYDGSFEGWKGGEFEYDDDTEVHFERDYSSWSNGMYCNDLIEKISKNRPPKDSEMLLVTLAFASKRS